MFAYKTIIDVVIIDVVICDFDSYILTLFDEMCFVKVIEIIA